MKPRLRYSLIGLFFLAFLILAPFVVSYVTGIKYDFQTGRLVRTGSIYAKTQPSKAQIFLNGKLAGQTPANLRFLQPGNYQVLIRAAGYFDWQKNLNVRAEYVSYVNQDLDYLSLFRTEPQNTALADNVLDFYAGKKRILYLTDSTIFLADVSSPDKTQHLNLPQVFSNLRILAAADENYYLIYNDSFYAVFDARNNKLADISATINRLAPSGGQSNGPAFQFGNNGSLLFSAKSNLYQIDWQNNNASAFTANIAAYRISGNLIYLLRRNVVSASISLSVVPADRDQAESIVISGLPEWSEAQIFLDGRNQPFILGDGSFYSIGAPINNSKGGANSLNRIADAISAVQIYDSTGTILLASNNEIDLYNYFTGEFNSVTRSSQPITSPELLGDLGWVLYFNAGQLHAIEIDNRDHQNDYNLAAAGTGADFFITPDNQKLFLLDGGKLSELAIR